MHKSQHAETQSFNGDAENGGFLLGLLTGAALGAVVGLMLAPKPGAELRKELSSTTELWRQKAAESYKQASETAADMMSKGRQAAERGRKAFQSARQSVEQSVPGSTGAGSTGMFES